MKAFVENIITSSNATIRTLYQKRNNSHPTDGNRSLFNVAICLGLLTAMLVALFHVEHASIYPATSQLSAPAHLAYPTGYLTRHMMAIFVILLFLFIDGSPETLGLGVFLGCEAVARSLDYQWIEVPHTVLVQHYLFQMGDIIRIFFALQLARVGHKELGPWIKWGSILSIPYGLGMELSPVFTQLLSPSIRTYRDVAGGLFCAWVCGRVAFAIAKDKLPLRVIALSIATVAFLESPVNILWDTATHGHSSVAMKVTLGFYRTLSYYLFALSAFINISTIEHRVRALSRSKTEQDLRHLREEQRVYEAIAKTTQMLAHDVRKPFSLFKAYFDTLAGAEGPDEARKILRNMQIDVQRSLKSVDRLIANVMDIDRETKMNMDPIKIDQTIATCLEQVFRVSTNVKVHFQYRFNHHGKIIGDEHQLQRVISNILENAEQAILGKTETITFITEQENTAGKEFIQLRIHNTGSFIPPENLPNIFDAFFTSGKTKGTGLGLAIVKKIITEHGGDVVAMSSNEFGTAFDLKLPAISTDEWFPIQTMPSHSEQLQLSTFADKKNPFITTTVDAASQIPVNLHVLIVDDEQAYASAVETNIKPFVPYATAVITRSPEEAIERIKKDHYDLLICDYYFEHQRQTGLDIIENFKRLQKQSLAILHTNHFINAGQIRRSDSDSEIDFVMAKPFSQKDFQTFVESHLKTFTKTSNTSSEIVLIDDEAIFIEAALIELTEYVIHIFEYPAQFDEAIKANPGIIDRIGTLIIDHSFGSDHQSGVAYAASIRERFGSKFNIVLHTNQNAIESQLADKRIIDAVATKGAANLKQVLKTLRSA